MPSAFMRARSRSCSAMMAAIPHKVTEPPKASMIMNAVSIAEVVRLDMPAWIIAARASIRRTLLACGGSIKRWVRRTLHRENVVDMGTFELALADRAGFEPAVAVTPRTLSKRVP